MTIRVWCYTCGRAWKQPIEAATYLELVAFDFCGCCRKQFLIEMEGQFPRKPVLRLEAKNESIHRS